MQSGLIHVYTGDGKGKTTAAIGLGVRAVGAGMNVKIVQFLKTWKTSELEALKKFEPNLKVYRFEKPRGFVWNLNSEERDELKLEVREAFEFIKINLKDGSCDLLIMDEIIGAITNGFISSEEIIEVLLSKKENVEVVMTGRNIPLDIQEIAHYVSEIKCIKHPYESGIEARKGIEF